MKSGVAEHGLGEKCLGTRLGNETGEICPVDHKLRSLRMVLQTRIRSLTKFLRGTACRERNSFFSSFGDLANDSLTDFQFGEFHKALRALKPPRKSAPFLVCQSNGLPSTNRTDEAAAILSHLNKKLVVPLCRSRN